MGIDEEVERLQSELRVARSLLEGIQAVLRQTAVRPFADTVQCEKRRSERYNHYFSVLLLASEQVSATDLLGTAAGLLRGTDILGIVDGDGSFHLAGGPGQAPETASAEPQAHTKGAVGIILPETDREGTEMTLSRLKAVLTPEDGVKVGCAIYPDDGTDAEQLLSVAAA